jgi:hypothetical protein
VAVLLGCWHSYSYSEQVFGTTTNAADAGLNWVMTNVLPQATGLTVSNVIYSYTTIKNEEDAMIVYVQNEDAQNEGQYIFREKDDWTGIPGNTINKLVRVGQVPIDRWGDGSIEWEGEGKVVDPFVAYTYQYDTCYDPQSDPECPGYKIEVPDIPNVEPVDPLADDVIQDELDREMTMRDEDDEEEQERRQVAESDEEEEEVDLEQVLGIVGKSLQTAQDTARHNQQMALNAFSNNYFDQLPDTVYNETIELKDGTLPKNRRGRRLQFAQDLLHEKLVKSQYKGEQ